MKFHPDPVTGEPVSAGKEPSKYGPCHLASTQSGSTDDFQPREDWFCSEHPLLQRDRLAAMAMQGLLASLGSDRLVPDAMAHDCYLAADALLAERTKVTP
jgi:hypothetical protein